MNKPNEETAMVMNLLVMRINLINLSWRFAVELRLLK